MEQLLLHPLCLLLVVWTLGIAALLVRSYTLRFFLIHLHVPIILLSTATSINYVRPLCSSLFAAVFFIYYVHLNALFLVSDSAFGIRTSEHTRPSLTVQCKHGMALLCDFRRILHPPVVAKVPLFSYDATPSKSSFVFAHSIRFLITYLILDALSINPPPDDRTPFGPPKVPILYNLLSSNEETVLMDDIFPRIIITAVSWLNVYVMIQCLTSFFFVLIVVLDLVPFDICRPMFGSISSASSIRNFWGDFWHQIVRFKFTTSAEHFVHDIIGIPKSWRLVSRYAKIIVVFALSGIMHLIADAAQGMYWRDSGAMRFFLMQAGGIIFEDGARTLFSRSTAEKGKASLKSSKWSKAFGYPWFALWMVWTTPGWFYPAIYNSTGSRIIPYSILQRNWTT